MAPDLDQQDPLKEAFDSASTELAPSGGIDKELPVVPEVPAWEAPSWTSRWKPEARDALGKFASNAEYKSSFDPLFKQLEETNGYITRTQQEHSDYKRRVDPLYDIVRPYEQRYALQGMTTSQGIGQLLQVAELLAEKPDEAFPWLAGNYKPQDANKALASLAQQWGVDLQEVGYNQPYEDPSVAALKQQINQMSGYLQAQQGQQQQAQENAALQEVIAFESAVDETGNLLYPHFRDCFDDMLAIVQMGKAQDLKGAYDLATRYNSDIQEKTMTQRLEAAQKKALEEAAARTAQSNKAENASRTIGGKTKSQNDTLTLREAFNKANSQLSG